MPKSDEDKFFTENRLAFGKCKENGGGTHLTVFRKVRYYEDGLTGYSCVRQCIRCGKTFDGKHRVFVPSNLDRKGYYVEPKPIKELHCPMMHFGQGTDDGDFVRENICEKVNKCFVGTYFSKCAETNRESCWKKYADLKGE